MDSSRKRGSSRSASDRRKPVKRARVKEDHNKHFTEDEKFIIAQTASTFKLPPESLAAAIASLQKNPMERSENPRKVKPRPEARINMRSEKDIPAERFQHGNPRQHEKSDVPFYQPASSDMQNSERTDSQKQRIITKVSAAVVDDCYGFKIMPAMWSNCFGSATFCDESSSYEQIQGTNQNILASYKNQTYPSEKNSNISATPIYPNTGSFQVELLDQFIQKPQQQPFACDDPYVIDPWVALSLSQQYPPMQAAPPMSNIPDMIYPQFDSSSQNYANIGSNSEKNPYYSEGLPSSENDESPFLSAGDDVKHRRSLSTESDECHTPIRARMLRSPVDRVQTAQTRQHAACVRCKMQRIRCIPDPMDPRGVCITCKKVSKLKVSKIPCLRYRITDARLFKQGYLPGHVWTTRFQTMDLNDIENWDSTEVKTIQITYNYSPRPLNLPVRKFKPQDGDMLHRSWKHHGVKKSVLLPPYAIASFEAAEKIYEDYINEDGPQFFASTIDRNNKLLWETMSAALKASNCAMSEPERLLLKMVLRVWVAGRFLCRSEIICGSDTLGLPSNLVDETNPALHGKIPIPPVMGAQIELIITSRILNPLRAAVLEKLQKIILVNKPQNWFCIYLCIFILLHNCTLVTQQDTAYAKKHGLKTRFAMIDLIGELHMGANILLAYFHYCTKGFRPFSLEWDSEQTRSMADLSKEQIEFVKKTALHVKAHESRFGEMFDKERYDDDLYFVAQMYEDDWKPRTTKVDSPVEV